MKNNDVVRTCPVSTLSCGYVEGDLRAFYRVHRDHFKKSTVTKIPDRAGKLSGH